MAASMTSQLLSTVLPPEVVNNIQTYLLHEESAFQTYKRVALAQCQTVYSTVYPRVEPLVERVLALMAENQGYAGIAVAVAVATTVVVVMTWVHRLMMWWTRVVARLAVWAVAVGVLAVVWSRGPTQTTRDLVVVVSKVMGFAAVVKDIWLEEYHQYESQQKAGAASSRAQR